MQADWLQVAWGHSRPMVELTAERARRIASALIRALVAAAATLLRRARPLHLMRSEGAAG